MWRMRDVKRSQPKGLSFKKMPNSVRFTKKTTSDGSQRGGSGLNTSQPTAALGSAQDLLLVTKTSVSNQRPRSIVNPVPQHQAEKPFKGSSKKIELLS